MDIIPDINCTACNQKFPLDRDCCPYCRTPIKSYWFEDKGNIKRAIPYSENGSDYLFIDGQKLSAINGNELPYAFKFMTELKTRQPKNKYYRLAGQATRLLLKDTFLGQVAQLFLPTSEDNSRLPSQWDAWLD